MNGDDATNSAEEEGFEPTEDGEALAGFQTQVRPMQVVAPARKRGKSSVPRPTLRHGTAPNGTATKSATKSVTK
jgi:hypothetical protein